MSRATPDDQLKFLLNCVKHSNNGKIDFVEVAKECGIVSKGAAAKRYERLMKANGIHPNGGPSDKPPTPSVPKERSKAAIAKAAAAKKRKIEGDSFDAFKNNDDDDGLPFLPKEESKDFPIVKQEATPVLSRFPQQVVQHHPISPPDTPGFVLSSSATRYPSAPTPQYGLNDSPSIFDEFCNPELFSEHSFEVIQPAAAPRTTEPEIPPLDLKSKVDECRETPWGTSSANEPRDTILIID